MDVAAWGPEAYRSIRDEQPPPLAFLKYEVRQSIRRQRWNKCGNCNILLEGPCQLVVGMPVVFQHQNAKVMEVRDDYVLLDRAVTCRNIEDRVIIQPCTTSDSQVLQRLVHQVWDPLWNQSDQTVVHDALKRIIDGMPDYEECPFQDFQDDTWHYAIGKANKHSARGACGYSVYELQCLPKTLIEMLRAIFRCVDDFKQWPVICNKARVVMLARPGESMNSPENVRPITIPPLIECIAVTEVRN